VIEAIALRLIAAENALDEVACNPAHSNSFISCELAVLQIRLICELILLGSTLAHQNEGGKVLDDRKWRPKHAFGELQKLNDHPLPFPVKIYADKNGSGSHHADPVSKALPYEILSQIYGLCGDLLHAPSARQVVKANIPSFDISLLQRWLAGIKQLIVGHALMLPERKKILLCSWSGIADQKPSCFVLDAEGPSTLDVDGLPDFNLLP
jgi:hypothetical protein